MFLKKLKENTRLLLLKMGKTMNFSFMEKLFFLGSKTKICMEVIFKLGTHNIRRKSLILVIGG